MPEEGGDLRPVTTIERGLRGADFPCPYGACEGTGFVLDEESNTARPCRCREQRISLARSRSLTHEIPRKYRNVGFDRSPISDLDSEIVRKMRRFCDRIDERLDAGDSLWFFGDSPGTGKTALAMLVSQHALGARRSVAIYTGPQLLTAIRTTYDQGATHTYSQLIDRLRSVDLLHIDDLAVARTTDWVLEQLYTIVNDRYQDERSILITTDVAEPSKLGEHVGRRTVSRLSEMCGEEGIIPMFGADRRVQSWTA